VKTKQNGFSLVAAIFILVVLALLGSYMVRLAGTQRTTTLYAIQGARAYQAARAGIEWSIARIVVGGACSDITGSSPMNFAGINDFSVTLTCSRQTYSEGLDNPNVFRITAFSEFASYTSPYYISRKLEVSIVN
jgi:MSHA biogenesis protein MshP